MVHALAARAGDAVSRAWRWYWPLYALVAPLIVVALAYAVIVCKAHSWRWQDGCLTFIAGTFERDGKDITRMWGRPAGQCFVPIIGFASEEWRELARLQVHERTHVAQGFICVLAGLAIMPTGLVALDWPLWIAPAFAWCVFPVVYGLGFAWHYPGALARNWSHAKRWALAFDAAYRANPLEVHARAVEGAFLAMPPEERRYVWGGA